MVSSTSRGHAIILIDGIWVYEDDNTPVRSDRPCARCGKPPTQDGHDACIGFIQGAKSACCGHGVAEPIIVMEE